MSGTAAASDGGSGWVVGPRRRLVGPTSAEKRGSRGTSSRAPFNGLATASSKQCHQCLWTRTRRHPRPPPPRRVASRAGQGPHRGSGHALLTPSYSAIAIKHFKPVASRSKADAGGRRGQAAPPGISHQGTAPRGTPAARHSASRRGVAGVALPPLGPLKAPASPGKPRQGYRRRRAASRRASAKHV